MTSWMEQLWYGRSMLRWLLWPVSLVYQALSRMRQFVYEQGWIKQYTAPIPVIIVGNISIGGTGKTPLTIALVELLQQSGWRPGVVGRGYGGNPLLEPTLLTSGSMPDRVGDEPVLIFERTGVPVCVYPERRKAIETLLEQTDVDIVILDDGLQHYALHRDIEIAVVDSDRLHGNGMCLPAGPLREPVSRLGRTDYVVYNGDVSEAHFYKRRCEELESLSSGENKPVSSFSGTRCHAVAGIGNPAGFFKWLTCSGIEIIEHVFDDHHRYGPGDLSFNDEHPIIMTEKDAVKCRSVALQPERCWKTLLEVELSPAFIAAFKESVASLKPTGAR